MRKKFELFCYKNRDKGIPNLMLYIVIGSAIVYFMSEMANNDYLYNLLRFDRTSIFQGQIWRLITYPLTYDAGRLLPTAISLFCFYTLGRVIEYSWGTLRFNLFYLTGIVMMDVYCLLIGGNANVNDLNLSLFLAYSTLYPDSQFLLFFIIPFKAWIFALVELLIVLFKLVVYPFPYNFFSVISLANYFLFFGKDVLNVLPRSWRYKLAGSMGKKPKPAKAKVIHFSPAPAQENANYTHKCTVCGRTDVTNPELEFRYCSRCKGYYCYCQDHINDHTHIQ